MKKCIRCGTTENLEEDHIIPKSRGGSDDPSNKRILCKACHDHRHARDNIIQEINRLLRRVGTTRFNATKLSMWIFRLGVLEAFNTPEKIKERGTYKAYWDFPETHYARWCPKMQMAKENRTKTETVITNFV